MGGQVGAEVSSQVFFHAVFGPIPRLVTEGTLGLGAYVEVSRNDMERCLRRALLFGGWVVLPQTDIPLVASIAVISDPNGNRIGLVSSPEALTGSLCAAA